MNADLPTLQAAGAHSGFTISDQNNSKQHRGFGSARLGTRFQSLGLVLERLWSFHEAMRTSKPLEHSDEMLADLGRVLHRDKDR